MRGPKRAKIRAKPSADPWEKMSQLLYELDVSLNGKVKADRKREKRNRDALKCVS